MGTGLEDLHPLLNVLNIDDVYKPNERFVIIEKYEKNNNKNVYYNGLTIHSKFFYNYSDNNQEQFHRLNGQPAIIGPKILAWFKDGKLHRSNNKPAFLRMPMSHFDDMPVEQYAVDGKIHRDFDQPAVIYGQPNIRKIWFQNGKIHRENNKPAIISKNFLHYFLNGECYDVKIIWKNKFITFLIENPLLLVGFYLSLFIMLFFVF